MGQFGVTAIAAWVGLALGLVSLCGVLVAFGVYKEKIDTHERWLRLILENAVMAAERNSKITRRSALTVAPEFVQSLTPEILDLCRQVAKESKLSDDCILLGNRVLRKLQQYQVLDHPGLMVGQDGLVLANFASVLILVRQMIRERDQGAETPAA